MNETQIDALYANNDYMTAYAAHTDARVTLDPEEAVGGAWEQVGQFQFHYLIAKGLRKDHKLLDIGCGTLRGGRYFIEYLDCGGYTGLDISPKALEFGQKLVSDKGLSNKQPRLLLDADKRLRFEELAGQHFDFILAQSVFTHLPKANIEECFSHIGAIMKTSSFFYFTFLDSRESTRLSHKDFGHPAAWFDEIANIQGFKLEHLADCAHPRGQSMAVARRGS